jgi:hypothetical protein
MGVQVVRPLVAKPGKTGQLTRPAAYSLACASMHVRSRRYAAIMAGFLLSLSLKKGTAP